MTVKSGKAPVGFTGTQIGMSSRQKEHLRRFLTTFCNEFHHGDCIGADQEAHEIALEVGIPLIVIHPPIHRLKRAMCHTKYPHGQTHVTVLPERDYLDRNHDIVDNTLGLVAGPKSDQEELRSGTWATVRYARKLGRYLYVLPR